MSRARGIVTLVLATAIGVGNGIWVFGPAFKEQRELKNEEARKTLEVAGDTKEDEIRALRAAEAAASKTTATESALRPEGSSSSRWPTFSLWAGKSTGEKPSTPTVTASDVVKNDLQQPGEGK